MNSAQDCVDAIADVRRVEAHPEPNVLRDGEMRKQSVALRDVRETTLLRRPVDSGAGVEPDLVAASDDAFLRKLESGEAAKDRRLTGSRRPEQDHHTFVASLDVQVCLDADRRRVLLEERGYEPIGHPGPERRCSRYVAASTTKENASRSAAVRPARA